VTFSSLRRQLERFRRYCPSISSSYSLLDYCQSLLYVLHTQYVSELPMKPAIAAYWVMDSWTALHPTYTYDPIRVITCFNTRPVFAVHTTRVDSSLRLSESNRLLYELVYDDYNNRITCFFVSMTCLSCSCERLSTL